MFGKHLRCSQLGRTMLDAIFQFRLLLAHGKFMITAFRSIDLHGDESVNVAVPVEHGSE